MARYSAKLMEHFSQPRNGRPLVPADAVGQATNNGSAPRVTIFLRIASERIELAGFQTFGCGVTIAACSALTELVTGQTVTYSSQITVSSLDLHLDGVPPDKRFCLTVPIEALHNALAQLPCSQSSP